MTRVSANKRAPCFLSTEPRESDPASLVAARLRRSGYPFLWGIWCEFSQGLLRLSGTVPTFHLKQLAQELAAHTPGVRVVQNDMQVTGQRPRVE